MLEDARLITRRADAQWRVCRLKPEPLQKAVDWIEHHRRFWEASLDRLAVYLEDTAPPAAPAAARKRRSTR